MFNITWFYSIHEHLLFQFCSMFIYLHVNSWWPQQALTAYPIDIPILHNLINVPLPPNTSQHKHSRGKFQEVEDQLSTRTQWRCKSCDQEKWLAWKSYESKTGSQNVYTNAVKLTYSVLMIKIINYSTNLVTYFIFAILAM